MNYEIYAESKSGSDAELQIKKSNIIFGTTKKTDEELPNPAELFLGAIASCILKNVERFSGLLKFDYDKAVIKISAIRLERPPRIDQIQYELQIYSSDQSLNIALLKKNIEKFGTIYNTVKQSCSLDGTITTVVHE